MSDEQDQVDTTETEADTPEDIQTAKEMGWVEPKDWKGNQPKNGFLSAKEYVRRGEKIMPIVRAEARKWEERARKLEDELTTTRSEHSKTIGRIERMSTLALDQQRAQIEEKYAAKIEAAADVGDKDAVRQARKDEKEAIAALDKRLEEPEETADKGKGKAAELPKPVQEIINAWQADNRWYTDDPTDEMTALANSHHAKLLREKKGLSLAENLAEVTKYVRKRFPEHFDGGEEKVDDETEEERKPRGSRVEGGSRNGGGGGGPSSWSKVPADARKVAESAGHLEYFLKSGETMEKDAPKARERWAAKYLEGDQA